jgi:AcrR family transcriptional regulator
LQNISTNLRLPTKKIAPTVPARKPRADAERNRARILKVAKEAFTRNGAAASLDDIARQAAIGPGTLYRHFPTRDSLIEAVYRSEVEKLAAAEQRFAATLTPLNALRAWMQLFIDHVSEKRLIIPAMDSVAGGSIRLIEGARSLIQTAFVASVKRAIASGDLRSDTDPNDFVRALVGTFHTTAMPGWEASARRLVDILIAGSRSMSMPASKLRQSRKVPNMESINPNIERVKRTAPKLKLQSLKKLL